jgi:pyrimidine operon attenuation protein/uracil phosphoribosyltransferase
MDAEQMKRALVRIAHEIVERNGGAENLIIVGIQRRGVQLAERIAAAIESFEGHKIAVGTLDITLYRDDLTTLGPQPRVGETSIPMDIQDQHVVLVDDVLYTGRTVRAALDELMMDFGRARTIQLAVLLGLEGMNAREIYAILDTARSFHEILERPVKKVPTLRGRTMINAFFEPSTRTRVSFELAQKRLSADTINISTSGSSMVKGDESRHDRHPPRFIGRAADVGRAHARVGGERRRRLPRAPDARAARSLHDA